MNLKTEQWESSNVSGRKKKNEGKGTNPIETVGHHQVDQHRCHRDPNGEETANNPEKIFDKITSKHFPNLMNMNLYIQETQQTQSRINSKITLGHTTIKPSGAKCRLEINKIKTTYHGQGILNIINSHLLIRNLGGQKAVGWHI